jgi:hypothetical protein
MAPDDPHATADAPPPNLMPATIDSGFVPEPGPLLPPTTAVGGRFTVLRLHAQGGLGRVSVARDERLGREVSLKEVQPDRAGSHAALRRFRTEAAITGQLEHPDQAKVWRAKLAELPASAVPQKP